MAGRLALFQIIIWIIVVLGINLILQSNIHNKTKLKAICHHELLFEIFRREKHDIIYIVVIVIKTIKFKKNLSLEVGIETTKAKKEIKDRNLILPVQSLILTQSLRSKKRKLLKDIKYSKKFKPNVLYLKLLKHLLFINFRGDYPVDIK